MKIRLLLAAILAGNVFAMGPKIPCMLSWIDVPGATGYYVYWRMTNGVYSDTQRIGVAPNQKPFDLRTLNLAKGQYFVTMTSTNATSESEPATEYQWNYQNPNKPTIVTISTP